MENPFVVTGKIKPEYFCDRVEEAQRLVRCVTHGQNMVIMSPRRVGKSKLIDFCFEKPEIRNHFETISIDILRTTSLSELTYVLGKAVFERVGRRSQRMMKMVVNTLKSINGCFGYDPISNTPTFDLSLGDIANPQYTLEEIFQCLEQADTRCIVAIDEFQQIVNYDEKNIEAILRTHIQKCSNTNFIFAGSERNLMNEMFTDSARPFYNSSDIMNIEVIDKQKYIDFVKYHFSAHDKWVDVEAIAHVYDIFQGNTYYNQKTFHEAFIDAHEEQACTVEMVDEIVHNMILDNDRKFSEILSRLSLPQKELLYAIAKEGDAKQITSMRFIKKHNLRSASSTQTAIKKLLEYHLVSHAHGAYYVDDPLMKLWL